MSSTIHDSGYTRLFSNRTIFRQLIETFVHEEWVRDIDFSQAETLDKSFVSDHYKATESDLIYKVGFRGHEAYLVILLEFQSTVDRFMALRVLNYVTNFYMDYVESTGQVNMLPPVFPIVLYNGDDHWSAPETIEALIQDVRLLGPYAPSFQYCKMVEREYTKDELLAMRNIVATIFLAETYYDGELLTQQLLEVFTRTDDRRAVSLLLNWFKQLAEHGRIDSSDAQAYEHLYETIEEVKSMLQTALAREHERIVAKERDRLRAEVRREVQDEVRMESLFEGLLHGVNALVNSKFGEAGQSLMQEIADLRNVTAIQETLECLVTASTIEEVADFVKTKKKSLHN